MTSPAPDAAKATQQHRLFQFEADLAPTLHCIPMAVRYKLDRLGLKVSLKAWNRLSLEQRRELLEQGSVDTPEAEAALRAVVTEWLEPLWDDACRTFALEPTPPWNCTDRLPEAVAELGGQAEPPLSVPEWVSFTVLERVALVKLAASQHERGRFATALAEIRSSVRD